MAWEGLGDSRAIEDDWRVQAMGTLREDAGVREIGQDAMAMVLSILVRGSPPETLNAAPLPG